MDYGVEIDRLTGAGESSLLLLLLISSLINRHSPPSCSQKDQGELKVARSASHHNARYIFLLSRSERRNPSLLGPGRTPVLLAECLSVFLGSPPNIDPDMMDAMVGLTWLCGAFSGALWGAALEREEKKDALLYGRSMVFFYSLCALIILVLSL